MNKLLQNSISESFFGKPFSAESLFCDLTPKTRKSLAKIKKQVKFRKHESIFSAGELPFSVYVLVAGKAQLYINTAANKRCIVRNILHSELLGLPELLAYFPYETGIEAVTACYCDCFPREDFINFLQTDSNISFRLLSMLGTNLQTSYRTFSSSIIQ